MKRNLDAWNCIGGITLNNYSSLPFIAPTLASAPAPAPAPVEAKALLQVSFRWEFPTFYPTERLRRMRCYGGFFFPVIGKLQTTYLWLLAYACISYYITVFSQFNAPGIYFKLGIVDPAFIRHPKVTLAPLFMKKWVFFIDLYRMI